MDKISKEARSRNMAAIKGKNTSPELAVRRLVHSLGYRYRLHKKDLPGTPDISIDRRRKAIFVNGCFWHHHRNCSMAYKPKSNRSFWLKKIKENVKRDRKKKIQLTKMGWSYLVIWECELKAKIKTEDRIKDFLSAKK